MTDPSPDCAKAVRDAAKARMRLTATTIGRRLRPRTVAQDAVDGIRDRAVEAAEDAVDAVRARPRLTLAAIALVAVAIAVRLRRRRDDATGSTADSYSADWAKRPEKGSKP